MKNKLIIRNPDIKETAIRLIESMPLEPLHQVEIREYHKDRTLAQNSLMWYWITIIAGERGEIKDDIHCEYKKKYLVPIFERDDPEYAKMIQAVRDVQKAGMQTEARHLADQIVKLTSTTDADVKQFTEYLNDMEHGANKQGIPLPHPEDRYYEAMGK